MTGVVALLPNSFADGVWPRGGAEARIDRAAATSAERAVGGEIYAANHVGEPSGVVASLEVGP